MVVGKTGGLAEAEGTRWIVAGQLVEARRPGERLVILVLDAVELDRAGVEVDVWCGAGLAESVCD
jgi:hypothetical protein